jgi:hypothetical protein
LTAPGTFPLANKPTRVLSGGSAAAALRAPVSHTATAAPDENHDFQKKQKVRKNNGVNFIQNESANR